MGSLYLMSNGALRCIAEVAVGQDPFDLIEDLEKEYSITNDDTLLYTDRDSKLYLLDGGALEEVT